MKIYLFLKNKLLHFSLPQEISGSYSFDFDNDEESKLINIEARDNVWVLYSTEDVSIDEGGAAIPNKIIESNKFYTLKRNKEIFVIYVSDSFEENLRPYVYNEKLNLVIGKDKDCNIKYDCRLFEGSIAKISYSEDKYILEKKQDSIYINNLIVNSDKQVLKYGDQINIYSLKIIFLNNLIFINNPYNEYNFISPSAGLINCQFRISQPKDMEIKDVNLYSKNDYYSKAPRIKRMTDEEDFKLAAPPGNNNNEELPFILTVGPMLTMAVMSFTTVASTMTQISAGKTTVKEQWPTLLTSGSMLISMLVWPIVTSKFNKIRQKRKQKELFKKYKAYLKEKRVELDLFVKNKREVLYENLITPDACLNIIEKKGIGFWDKRVDQDDFLVVRVGIGKDLLNANINYSKEEFTVDEYELRKLADELADEYKYIEDVPIGYSLHENKITAVMGNYEKGYNFINNIILQLLTFYSYEDLKLVVFTSKNNEVYWDYIKYLNHNFNNERDFRFFSSNTESSKVVCNYLSNELNYRLANKTDYPKPHYVIIIDDYDSVKRQDFMKDVTETDENVGFSLVFLENKLSKLPSKCNNFISIGADSQCGILKNSFEEQEQIYFKEEINYGIDMMKVAKHLSNIPIEFEEELSQLPEAISFIEMEKVGKVEQLNILNRWNLNDSTTSLRAEVGVDEQGDLMYLDLHEKFHGPHGLIAGTTGSGKSEFIITYILSMCINYSPDDVAFILIDYKGGGLALAFDNKSLGIVLPHLAGTITNLDKADMDRTLVSIDSEVKRRQKMFNDARDKLGESTIDIYKYQKFYKEGRLTTPIPHLFIICDEFAELKNQQPEFMDNLISVARIGRSLGVHLILATQKPSGVVNDQIWSNSKFKVCLKVQDESDSNEMLKKKDAAYLKQAGRFYLQVGYDEYYALGQSGWCGAKYYPSDKVVKQVDKSINFIDECGSFIKSIKASGKKVNSQGEQLGAILKSIVEVADKQNKRTRKLWLDNIPAHITVNEVSNKYNVQYKNDDIEAVIGEYDAPELQEQGIVKYNYLKDGNTIIYGNDGSERELLLNAIIYSTTKNYSSDLINFYAVDYGAEALVRFNKLPHFGGVVLNGEDEKFNNLLKMLKEEIARRKKLFVDYGSEYINYIKATNAKLPIMVVIFNNYDSINESYQNLYEDLPELVRDSDRYGIVYIFTCNATNSINSKTSTNFNNAYAFKLKDAFDYSSIFNSKTKITPREINGRGVLRNNGVHEFQTAYLINEDEDLNDFLTEFIKEQKEKNQNKAKLIPVLPDIVRFDEIEASIEGLQNVPIGMSKKTLEIVRWNLINNVGNILSSNKLIYTSVFIKSLLMIFKKIVNNNIFIFDPMSILNIDSSIYKNYYNSNIDEVVGNVIDSVQKMIDEKQNTEGVIVIFGLNKFLNSLNDHSMDDLSKVLKKYEKIPLIMVEEVNKFKSYLYESWLTSIINASDGVWVGKGVADQSLIRISGFSKELTQELPNNMGIFISEGSYQVTKLIDLISKEDDTDGK